MAYKNNEIKLGKNDLPLANPRENEVSMRIDSNGAIYTRPEGMNEVLVTDADPANPTPGGFSRPGVFNIGDGGDFNTVGAAVADSTIQSINWSVIKFVIETGGKTGSLNVNETSPIDLADLHSGVDMVHIEVKPGCGWKLEENFSTGGKNVVIEGHLQDQYNDPNYNYATLGMDSIDLSVVGPGQLTLVNAVFGPTSFKNDSTISLIGTSPDLHIYNCICKAQSSVDVSATGSSPGIYVKETIGNSLNFALDNFIAGSNLVIVNSTMNGLTHSTSITLDNNVRHNSFSLLSNVTLGADTYNVT